MFPSSTWLRPGERVACGWEMRWWVLTEPLPPAGLSPSCSRPSGKHRVTWCLKCWGKFFFSLSLIHFVLYLSLSLSFIPSFINLSCVVIAVYLYYFFVVFSYHISCCSFLFSCVQYYYFIFIIIIIFLMIIIYSFTIPHISCRLKLSTVICFFFFFISASLVLLSFSCFFPLFLCMYFFLEGV